MDRTLISGRRVHQRWNRQPSRFRPCDNFC